MMMESLSAETEIGAYKMNINTQKLRNTTRRQNGFTLLEVLVAITIVSLSVVSIIQATARHVNNTLELEKRMVASWVASNHIAEIRFDARTEKISAGGKTERYKLGGQSWRSKARVQQTDVDRVYLVTVEVTADEDQKKRTYASTTTAVTDRL